MPTQRSVVGSHDTEPSPRRTRSRTAQASRTTRQQRTAPLPQAQNAVDVDVQENLGKDIAEDNEHYSSAEQVNEDDLCPICQLLLCNPVTTQCRHTLCKSCMATWADVSLTAPMTIVPVDEQARDFDAATGLEANCPMCRTRTTATLVQARTQALRSAYPKSYAEREAEEAQDEVDGASVQTLTVYIGNSHRRVEPDPDDHAQNTH